MGSLFSRENTKSFFLQNTSLILKEENKTSDLFYETRANNNTIVLYLIYNKASELLTYDKGVYNIEIVLQVPAPTNSTLTIDLSSCLVHYSEGSTILLRHSYSLSGSLYINNITYNDNKITEFDGIIKYSIINAINLSNIDTNNDEIKEWKFHSISK